MVRLAREYFNNNYSMTKPTDLKFAVDDRPQLYKLFLLGLQYVMLMSVYLVIISVYFTIAKSPPITIRSAISMGMIALAISATLQAIKKGPIGSGYLAAPVISAIYLEGSLLAIQNGGIPVLLGMTIFAGCVELIIRLFIKRLRLLFPPGISGLIITVVGLKIGILGITKVLDIANYTAPSYLSHILLAIFTLAMMIGFSIWGKGLVRLTCSMIGLIIGFVVAVFLNLVPPHSVALLDATPWFGIPHIGYISYHFNVTLIPVFTIAGIAAALRTVGVITSCQTINDADWKRPEMKSIKGGILADALGNIIAGFIGCPGMNTAPSLVGASKAAGATSRYIAFMAAVILIIFAFIPKLSSLFLIMPLSVIGAALVFTGGFMIVGGIQIMTSRHVTTRMTYIIGISLLVGLSYEIYPKFYEHLPYFIRIFSNSFLSLSVITAIILNLLFRVGIKRRADITIGDNTIKSYGEVEKFLKKKGKEWNLPTYLVERANETTKQLIIHLRHAKQEDDEITIMVTYDTIDLIISISYDGGLVYMPSFKYKKAELLEEEAFSAGLTEYLTGVYPDNIIIVSKDDKVKIDLYFSA